jgi:hypothetical protein
VFVYKSLKNHVSGFSSPLVGVREAAHTGSDAEDVVGHGVHEQFAVGVVTVTAHTGQVQSHVVEAGEIAGTGRLVGLGVQSEGVAVDVLVGHASVVLVGLHQAEVRRVALGETVVAVELQLGGGETIVIRGGERGIVDIRRIIIQLRSTEHKRALVRRADGPHELLHGVVEVQAHLIGLGGLRAGMLELLDEVLMRHLGETLTLLGVEVHVVHVQLGTIGTEIGETVRRAVLQVAAVAELDVELHFVVLKGDQGERKSGVAAEEELQGDVELLVLHSGGFTGVAATDHLLETLALLLGEGELGPDLKPLAVVLVDALAANFEFHVLDESVAHRVHETGLAATHVHLEPHVGHEIAVAADGAGHAGTGLGGAVERLLNGLHGEVGVAAVHHLEERDLGVPRQVNVLSADGNELHKSSSHVVFVCLYYML